MWNLVKGVMAAAAIFAAAKGIMDAIKMKKADNVAKVVALKLVEVSSSCAVLMAGAIGAAISVPWWFVGIVLYLVSFAAMNFAAKIVNSDAADDPDSAISKFNEMMEGVDVSAHFDQCVEVEVNLKKEKEEVGDVKPA